MTHQPHLTYIGHATTLIELAGVRLLTDPVLRRRVAHLNHRHAEQYERLVSREDWRGNILPAPREIHSLMPGMLLAK